MLFTKNGLSLQHKKGFGIRFCPIEALKTVNATEDLVHVAMSKEWLEARSNHADINKIAKRYDWTFTPSNYKGCLLSEENSDSLQVSVTDEKIDYERLKIQEKIVYFDEIILYEDELDDNGIAKLYIKIVSFLFPFLYHYFTYARTSEHMSRTIKLSNIFIVGRTQKPLNIT